MNQPTMTEAGVRGVQCGTGVRIMTPSNLYECTLGDDCFVGPFVEIQKGVHIGPRTRVQSHAFICELVTVGADCFISHGAKFVNDLFGDGGPAYGNTSKWRKTFIGNNVSIGTNATILPVTICDNVVVGAGAVVTKDIVKPGIYSGNPAKLMRIL
jgi:acetyltransferase-like isoleucine patch superfamily enzyme